MKWLGIILAMVVCSPAVAQQPAPIEVMMLGTYHMGNPGLDLANVKADDVLKPQRQRELESLSSALAEFKPTKIMVERQVETADLIDSRFSDFTVQDLGKVRNERVQIAYRLAQRLGLKVVYGIDEQPAEGEPDYFPFDKLAAWAKANGREAQLNAELEKAKAVVGKIEKLQAEGSVAHVLADLNRPEQAVQDQGWYYDVLRYGDTNRQPGAELNAYWYMRNAKIFAKLMTVAKPGDRILVVYGAGHSYWLRHFAATTPGYRSVDPVPFLKKAERRR